MKERSQLDAMRAAIRGDLDRARARRDSDPWRPAATETEGAPTLEPEVVPEPVEPPVEEPVGVEEPVAVGSQGAPPAPEPDPVPDPVAKTPRRGFLSSLFKRD